MDDQTISDKFNRSDDDGVGSSCHGAAEENVGVGEEGGGEGGRGGGRRGTRTVGEEELLGGGVGAEDDAVCGGWKEREEGREEGERKRKEEEKESERGTEEKCHYQDHL
jgi:hypothetical protein